MMDLTCSRDDCNNRTAVAVRTADGGLRGIFSTLYYEPATAPKGAELLCVTHGTELVSQLMRVMVGE